MRLTNKEKDLLNFLIKYPDRWHAYGNDAKTIRTVAGLYFCKGLGIRGFEVNKVTHQIYLDSSLFNLGKVL